MAPEGGNDEPQRPAAGSVLVVDDDELIRELLRVGLQRSGYEVTLAATGQEALERLDEALPDVIVSDVMMPEVDGFDLLGRLRSDTATRAIPVILLTSRRESEDVVAGLGLGADDYVSKPFKIEEVAARIAAKLARPPAPRESLASDRRSGLMSENRILEELSRELTRAARSGRLGSLAILTLDEMWRVRERLGRRAEDQVARQVGLVVDQSLGPLEVAGRDSAGRFVILLPECPADEALEHMRRLAATLVRTRFAAGGERTRLTPTVGLAQFDGTATAGTVIAQATAALNVADLHLDLEPVVYRPGMEATAPPRRHGRVRRGFDRVRVPVQIAVTVLIGMVLPFGIYVTLDRIGQDVTGVMYYVVVVALLVTAAAIWAEGLLALAPTEPPDEPAAPFPQATAIIAAYLPNEAATVVETVEAFLAVDYPAGLQVILAYNTTHDLPVEAELATLARRDPRFLPIRVSPSTSKAQNVNAALASAVGEFVGVFDADHHPAPDAFRRAWRWLSHGYDVVQGHCVVRNGEATWVAKTIAIEFEALYAVSHPGRARLHGFGIFGGSNGYWRTDLLRQTRMHGFMLTEDIDSSLRVVEAGYRIASDRDLLSRELAPATLSALWNQRMRWAQGWLQVSVKHLGRTLRARNLTIRQKLGFLFLLGWREFYPWISLQMFPIVAFWIWRRDPLDWFIPVFVLTTLFTMTVGPVQVLFAYRLAAPELRARRRWFLWYLFVSTVFYTEFKNLIGRVAQVKEAMREKAWKVTPRSAATPGGPVVTAAPDEAEVETDGAATSAGPGPPPPPPRPTEPTSVVEEIAWKYERRRP